MGARRGIDRRRGASLQTYITGSPRGLRGPVMKAWESGDPPGDPELGAYLVDDALDIARQRLVRRDH